MHDIKTDSSSYLFTHSILKQAEDCCECSLQPGDERWAIVLLHYIAPKIFGGLDVDFEDIAKQVMAHDKVKRGGTLAPEWVKFGDYLCTTACQKGSMTVKHFSQQFYKSACQLVEDVDVDFYEGEALPIEAFVKVPQGQILPGEPVMLPRYESREFIVLGFTDEEGIKNAVHKKLDEYIEAIWLDDCPVQYLNFIGAKKVKDHLYGESRDAEFWLGECHIITYRKTTYRIFEQ